MSVENTKLPEVIVGGSVSWCGFAKPIVSALGQHETVRVQRILSISSSEHPTPARRPLRSILCNFKFARTFGFSLGSWQSGLAEVICKIRLREQHRCSNEST